MSAAGRDRLVLMATGTMVALLVTWTAFTRTLIPLALDTTVVDVGYVDESGNQLRTLELADGRTVIVDVGLGDEVELEAQGGQGWAAKRVFAGALGGDYEIDLIGWLVRGESVRVALFSCCCLLVAATLTRPVGGMAEHGHRSGAVTQRGRRSRRSRTGCPRRCAGGRTAAVPIWRSTRRNRRSRLLHIFPPPLLGVPSPAGVPCGG